jgi:hypothetical protein
LTPDIILAATNVEIKFSRTKLYPAVRFRFVMHVPKNNQANPQDAPVPFATARRRIKCCESSSFRRHRRAAVHHHRRREEEEEADAAVEGGVAFAVDVQVPAVLLAEDEQHHHDVARGWDHAERDFYGLEFDRNSGRMIHT